MDLEVACALLESQHPDLMVGPLVRVDEGWDNFIYRIGSTYALRIPRRRAGVDFLVNEQRWLPRIARRLSVSVPLPVALGAPSDLYPWPWSVVEWIPGTPLYDGPLARGQAAPLAEFLRSLHRPAPPEAPRNPFRGVPLRSRRQVVEERLVRLGMPDLGSLWERALEAPASATSTWIHGDLHPRNVLVLGGDLAGVLDWGDVTGGDVATDLACAWMLLDAEGRSTFWEAYAATEAERSRALGWAVHFASATLDSGEARHVRIGRFIVRQLLDESAL